MRFRLGKKAPKKHPKTLRFADFLTGDPVPPAPPKRAWEYVIKDSDWLMYSNDVKGDCTLAAKAHIIMAATANAGHPVIPDPDEIVAIYDKLSPDDEGCAMTDVYDYWLKNPISGQKILGWVQIDHSNRSHFEQCVNLFSACDVGVQLPASAQDQFAANQPWNFIKNDGGMVGGHDVPYLGFGLLGETCVTWARRQPCSLEWFQHYVDEGYGVILDSWFDLAGSAPNGFNKDLLWKALQALKVN
jgi:hypothetical protein